MSHNITVEGGKSVRLLTAGKYCDRDIVVTAEGGFTPPEDEFMTPELVYQTTRPASWLQMPTPNDNEMYLLGLLIEGHPNQFSASVNFSGSCSVEFGTVQNGAFVSKETTAISSGTRFTKALRFEDYGNETSRGCRQYLVKVSGGFSYIDLLKETKNSLPNYIVDIVCGKMCEIVPGTTSGSDKAVQSLQYIRYVGAGQCSYAGTKFANCNNLLVVSAENETPCSWGDAVYAFTNCTKLCAVSPSVLGANPSLEFAFYWTSIDKVQIQSQPTNCLRAFQSTRITEVNSSSIDTSRTTNFQLMFAEATSLRTVNGLNIVSATNVTDIFYRCFSLCKLTFAGDTTPGGWTISLTETCLGHDALVEMIASLPTATAAATIAIAGVPGASELTDAEIAVATAKNWTITR